MFHAMGDVFMNTSEIDREERLSQLLRDVPDRGLERYPLILKDVCELPAELKSTALDSFAKSNAVETIISFPPQVHRGWHYVPRQALLFTASDVIHSQASIWPGQEPQVTLLSGRDIIYMRVSLLLLYGLLEIVAAGQTSPVRLRVEFNTVAWYPAMSRPSRKLLCAIQAVPEQSGGEIHLSEAAQTAVEKLPLKFFNGIHIYGLLPGEELKDLVFQPGTWKRWLLFFRRPVSPDTLLLLTSNFVVVIAEELGVKQGWVISYIPRENISEMQSQAGGLWNELTIHLERNDQTEKYRLLLKDEAIQDWRALWLAHDGRWDDREDELKTASIE